MPPVSPQLFSDVSGEWLAVFSSRRHSLGWHEKSAELLRKKILPRLGHLPFDSVQRKDVNAIVRPYAEAGKAVTANHVLITIRNVYNWAINDRDFPGETRP